jgi:hypothetical protein
MVASSCSIPTLQPRARVWDLSSKNSLLSLPACAASLASGLAGQPSDDPGEASARSKQETNPLKSHTRTINASSKTQGTLGRKQDARVVRQQQQQQQQQSVQLGAFSFDKNDSGTRARRQCKMEQSA